ncbi:hypothetical protein FEM48_Zijuj12G0122500 [Ziziphus jujuba var. spinosa]|uniref:non-specific serine/threonine protein kinase n=1 Tax=Ziziphus jujuba var. spinosa TaxID=714518 RepID=A0A978UD97_ZIZJJ|nr:hypothetical protein FEM48_Zijuj12G0122500 [Ziziphus jujuba var. spinosa]
MGFVFSTDKIVPIVVFGFLALNCFFTGFGSHAQLLPEDEVKILQTISDKLQNPHWNISRNSCSRSEGFNMTIWEDDIISNVTCDCSFANGTVCHVKTIWLKGLNLTGVLPEEFGNLTFLEEIDLTRNYISGPIPKTFRAPLQKLSLLGNRLNGSIPKEIGNITTLTDLVLEDNRLEGSLHQDLGSLSNLKRLLLAGNNFTGTIPVTFGNLKNLTDFRIDGSRISGKIPSFIGNWTQLDRLDMQGTSMEGPIPSSISLLKNLTELRISDLKGSSSLFPNLTDLTKLERLVMRNCLINDKIPDYIGNMKDLKTLDLSFNRLTGSIPATFQSLRLNHMFLTNNSLTGKLPEWIVDSDENFDLSYNNFTGPAQASCANLQVNRISSYSTSESNSWCLNKDLPCSGKPGHHSFFVNCGGRNMELDGNEYAEDISSGGKSNFFSVSEKWAYSSTGVFLGNDRAEYIASNKFSLNVTGPEYYQTARLSPISLKYYGLCMLKGSYKVQLHFAEIMFTDNETYSSVGKRIFDVSIQGNIFLKDFNIAEVAGGVGKGITMTHDNVLVNGGTLEIHLYWAGKGTGAIPARGVYGPLISAITVTPNFKVDTGRRLSALAIAGIVAGSCAFLLLVLLALRKMGYLGGKDLEDPDGSVIAVKQLSSKSKQGNREFVNEIGMISALQHPNLVKLYGCCIEGNQLLLIYEYMENNSLARALFGKCLTKNLQLEVINFMIGLASKYSLSLSLSLSRFLFDIAYVLQEQGNLLELVDPSLGSNYSKKEAMTMLNLALLCTNPSPTLRPPMSSVVSMLEGDIPVQAPIIKRNSAETDARFKAFEMLSQDSQTQEVSSISHDSHQRGQSMDGPWIDSSISLPSKDDHHEDSSSSKLL